MSRFYTHDSVVMPRMSNEQCYYIFTKFVSKLTCFGDELVRYSFQLVSMCFTNNPDILVLSNCFFVNDLTFNKDGIIFTNLFT